ncbi:PREDICTED: lamin-B1-like [Acropora digitifera]|uniref:lamin-B1-like n=1 Tax=Acropora digitifera TaxID=70779 RepID=UPI00077A6B28|nr:PREDICTED: lamin-B1-like [Acropora digitifera]
MATTTASPRTPASSERIGAASPTKMSREQEKDELQHLNSRLAVYIDRVNALEESNNKLTAEITLTKSRTRTEVESVKNSFESELADARRLLDETAKEKAREQMENRKNASVADEFKKKFEKEVAAHKKTEDELKASHRKLSEKEAQLSVVNQEARSLQSVLEELRKECQELKDSLESAKYALEQETLSRVDLENKLQSKDEELNFKKEMYNKEILDIRSQLKTVETQHIKIASDTKSRYEGMLAEKLQELRDLYDTEARQYRDETDSLYSSKYDELHKMSSKDLEELTLVREERRALSITVENLRSELNQLKSKNDTLLLRIEDLEKLRASDQESADQAISSRDKQIRELRKRMDSALRDYEDLMGVKTALDIEISTYRKMLEGEESRLNITPPASPVFGSSMKPSRRSVKRVRTEEESTGTKYSHQGYIQIKEANADGKYIKLFNSGSQDVSLGGWLLERSVDGDPAIVYKFTPKYVLKSGSYVTVWASQGGGQHKPPTDLVFRQKASWGVGRETRTLLKDADGQEAASAVSEEVSIVRTDEIDTRPVMYAKSDGETGKGCLIQ